jgi:integrase
VFRTFLKWANENDYTKYTGYTKWKRMSNDTEIISLTQDELMIFRDADLSNKFRLDKVRDLFVLGCYTGGRFSDYSRLTKADVFGSSLRIRPIKTGDKVVTIPLHPEAIKILEKYDYELPKISNQKFNDYLKELSKLLGINKQIIKSSYVGKDRTDTLYEKHELITSHVARKTFVTISLEKGIPAEIVMKVSGHKSYSSFKKYINISDKVTENKVLEGWKDL